MNRNTSTALIVIIICTAIVIFMYFGYVSSRGFTYDEHIPNASVDLSENNIDVKDMYLPVSLIKELDDSSLNGEVIEVLESKKYSNRKFGFSFLLPNEMKLSNESSELWKRDEGENFVKHYLSFNLDSNKKIVFNSEINPYQTLKDWEKTDEGNYRLHSDVVVEPEFKNISGAEAIIFDLSEFNAYHAFILKNNVLYEIQITGFSKEELEKVLNSIEFFIPVM